MLLSVKYPKDTESTKTKYGYDSMYHLVSTETTTNQGEDMSAEYTYTKDLLTKVTTGSSVYHFGYGDFSLRTSVAVGTTTLATYTYTEDVYHRLQSVTYGNGDKVTYSYDELGRVIKEVYGKSGSTAVSREVRYEYDNAGALATVHDTKTGITTRYYYDTVGRNTGISEKGGSITHNLEYSYDELGRVNKVEENCGGTRYNTYYTYYGNGQVQQVQAGNSTEKYVYDSYERLTQWDTYYGTSTSPRIEKHIIYDWEIDEDENFYTLDRVKEWSYKSSTLDATYTYRYDANGNIISETVGGKTTTYVYDSANQLIRENNQAAGKTWVWTYDNAGNIKSKTEYAYTTGALGSILSTTTYDHENQNWGDLLTAINGVAVTYDSIGNMRSEYPALRSYTPCTARFPR